MQITKNQEYAIEVSNVSKYFKVYYDKGYTLKEKVLFWQRNKHEVRYVLKNISFKVKKGEVIGLIGENGAGKSTALKLLSKIIYPNSGNILMFGRVACLIELGAGFHPDMSGRENIYTNAAIFGLTRKEIDRRINDIISFSELEDFIDNPVRTYSSGMYMRLAFSVAINVDADILLIDEILAVGDAAFQAKCFSKMREIKESGKTIVLVSHNLGQIEQICDRTIWFNNGIIFKIGKPCDIHPYYLEYMSIKEQKNKLDMKGNNLNVQRLELSEIDSDIKICSIEILDDNFEKNKVFKTGTELRINIYFKAKSEVQDVVFGIAIFRMDGLHCYGVNTDIDKITDNINLNKGYVTLIIKPNELLNGDYWIDVAIHKKNGLLYDYWKRCFTFKMYSDINDIGVCRLEHKWIVN